LTIKPRSVGISLY